MPLGKGPRPKPVNGIYTGLASRLIAPKPIGVAAVVVVDGVAEYREAGRTPGVARLLRAILPRLGSMQGKHEKNRWLRADLALDDLFDPDEGGPLSPFFRETG
jgi:hypothetical protein